MGVTPTDIQRSGPKHRVGLASPIAMAHGLSRKQRDSNPRLAHHQQSFSKRFPRPTGLLPKFYSHDFSFDGSI